jgi:hypothetical protein
MIDQLHDIINAEAKNAGFVKGVAGQVVHILSELVVDEDSGS